MKSVLKYSSIYIFLWFIWREGMVMYNERIELLYRILIEVAGVRYTKDILFRYGYTDEEIDFLLEKRIIKNSNDGGYELVSIDKFRRYGVSLLLRQKFLEANICFEKCYQLAPNGKEICFQYLLMQLKRRYPNYDEILMAFKSLDKIQLEKNKENNNLILYLLSFLTELPDEYASRVMDLNLDDLLLPALSCNKEENEVRVAIWKNKFTYAYGKLAQVTVKSNGYSPKFELMKGLLSRVIDSEKRMKGDLLRLAKTEQFAKMYDILNKRQQQRCLSSLDTYVLLIVDEILSVLNNGVISIPTISVTSDMYTALINKNFKLAQAINEEFLAYIGGDKEDDIVNILLIKLNAFIAKIKEDYDGILYDNQDICMVSEYGYEIADASYWVDYIVSEGISFEEAKKNYGFNLELYLIIKLVYAMNCYGYRYNEGRYYVPNEDDVKKADLILQEISLVSDKSDKVLGIMKFVSEYRAKVLSNNDVYKKILVDKE